MGIKGKIDLAERLLSKYSSKLAPEGKAVAKSVAKEASDQAPTIGSKNARSFEEIQKDIARIKSEKDILKANKYPKGFQQDELAQKPNFTIQDEVPLGVPVSDVPGQLTVRKTGLPVKTGEFVDSNLPTIRPNSLPDVIAPSREIMSKPPTSGINPKLAASIGALGIGTHLATGGFDSEDSIESPVNMSVGIPMSTDGIKPVQKIKETANTESNKQGAVKVQSKQIDSVKTEPGQPPQESLDKHLNEQIAAKQEEMDYLQEMKDARNTASFQRLMGGIIQAGQSANQAVTGVKQDAGQQLIDDADRHVTEAKENIALDKSQKEANEKKDLEKHLNDPNSPALASVNDMLSKLNQPVIPKGMTLGQYQKVTGIDASKLLGFIQNKETQESAHANSMRVAQLSAGSRAEGKAEQKDLARDKFAQGLRQELARGEVGKVYGNYLSAQRSTNALKQFAANPSAYSDYGSLMLGLKALQGDQSVVREAEVRMGVNATDLFSKFQNYTQRAMSGQSLQPHQRAEMAKAAEVLAEISKNQFKQVASPILNQAKAEGINENILLGGDFQQQAPTQPTVSTVKVQRISDGVTKIMSADKAAKIDISKYQVIK